MPRPLPRVALAIAGLLLAGPASAIVNPDLSVIGQPFTRWTDDVSDPARKRATLDAGETEIVFDAALNPYARATVIAAIGEEGLELEEGYFQLLRGLPGGLAIKGGKYRLGFGKLNPVHPHAYPFAERFRVLAEYLPGEESFGETAVQISELLPIGGDAALTIAADWLEGRSFRIERAPGGAGDPLLEDPENGDRQEEPRPGVLGRVSAFLPISNASGLELGASGTHGTNNVAAGARTTVLGVDAKLKLSTGPSSSLQLQAEALRLDREDAAFDPTTGEYATARVKPAGGYLFADYRFGPRWDAGVSYERWQRASDGDTWDQAFGVFAGLALMEETTAFRLGWERFLPGDAGAGEPESSETHALTLRVIFSMGPHKPHQF